MPIFAIQQNKLVKIKEISFKNEKEIQKLTEQSLAEVFGLDFIGSEVSLGGLRIDTLAFDNESKSFVVIEYKKDKNFSVIDQGYAYLALLLNNKADFILEYNESKNKNLRRDDVDWSQSKVIFISSQFTKYQRQAISFKDLPIMLYEISKFENGNILFNELKSPEASESINKISKQGGVVKEVNKEIKVYTEEEHLLNIPDEIKEFYNDIKGRVLILADNIEIRPRRFYISFATNKNFIDIHLQQTQLKLWLNLKKSELDDSKNIARDVSNIGHWGNGDYEIILKPGDDLDYLMTLIKQSYKKHT